LWHVERPPGALDRVIGVGCKALDGRHCPALHGNDRKDAGSGRRAVDMHDARATRADAAPELASSQAQVLAYNPK
jgi:hypothetical protein